jgi:putative endonuclease
MNSWAVYILSNHAHTLYTGMTGDLFQRVRQHKTRTAKGAFTSRYTFTRLVWYEFVSSREEALAREKQIKGWSRAKRVALIQAMNPNWADLTPKLLKLLMLS